MSTPLPSLFVLGLAGLAASAAAQESSGLEDAARRLEAMFERPAGQRISEAQKRELTAFVEAWEGKDLGRLGYARALEAYLVDRNVTAAAELLDAFFAEHDHIANDEHRMMAGRISLGAMRVIASQDFPQPERLQRYAERAARLYPDPAVLSRVLESVKHARSSREQLALDLAAARGLLDSELPPARKAAWLGRTFGPRAEGEQAAAPMTPVRRGGDTEEARARRAAAERAESHRAALTGRPAPPIEVLEVVNHDDGDGAPSIEKASGKVVLVDFTATWCGPCRKVIPELVALQRQHPDDLRVVGVTRLYGYATDFSGGRPETVRDLDRERETELNETFARHFELPYPIVITDRETMRDGWGVQGIPTLFVIGRDGKVAGHVVGAGEESHAELERLVARALEAR